MSTLKVNNLQVGQDSTATNNLTWFQPGSPDGTIRLGSGNAGSATSKFTFDKDGNLTCVGDITANSIIAPIEGTLDDWIVHAGDTNTKLGFPDADQFQVQTGGSPRLTVTNTYVTATGLLTVEGGSAAKPTFKHSAGWGALRVAGSAGGSGSGFILANNYSGTIEEKWSIYLDGSNDGLRFTAGPPETTAAEQLRITSAGDVGIGTVTPQGDLHIWDDDSSARIYLTSGNSNDSSIYFGRDNDTATAAIRNDHSDDSLRFMGYNNSERLRITSGGHIVTQGLTSYSFQNDSANAKIFEVSGDGTVGEYGVVNISGNQDANNSSIGALKFINRQNSNGSSGNNAGSKQVASIQAYIKTSDTNAGDNSAGFLTFHTKGEAAVNGERLRIDETGRVLIGGTSQVGDGKLIVYSSDKKHPSIKCAGLSNSSANGWTMLGDNYQSDESQINLGVSYSSSSLVLSRCVKVSDTADNTYLSSQDSYATRPSALVLGSTGELRYHTTETSATTTTDSAVSLTEVFQIDRVGNIYQRITDRHMYFGASNHLKIGVVSNDPVIDALSGDLQLKNSGSTIAIVRSDHLQMYQNIKMNNDKGISFINADDTATGETVSSSVLDDYEEGTWTTHLMDGNGSNVTYSNSTARYVKVGRMVYCYFNVTRSETGSKTGSMRFYNLPYVATNSTMQVTGTWWMDLSQTSGQDAVGGAIYIVQNQRQCYFVYPTTEFQPIGSSYRYLQFSHWDNLRPMYGSFVYEAAN